MGRNGKKDVPLMQGTQSKKVVGVVSICWGWARPYWPNANNFVHHLYSNGKERNIGRVFPRENLKNVAKPQRQKFSEVKR